MTMYCDGSHSTCGEGHSTCGGSHSTWARRHSTCGGSHSTCSGSHSTWLVASTVYLPGRKTVEATDLEGGAHLEGGARGRAPPFLAKI